MGTITTSESRRRQLVQDMRDRLDYWERSEPSYPALAGITEGWRNSLDILREQTDAEPVQNAVKAIHEAWYQRDNRTAAIKAIQVALGYLDNTATSPQAGSRNPAVKANLTSGDNGVNNMRQENLQRWIQELHNHINPPSIKSTGGAVSPYRMAAEKTLRWIEDNHPVYQWLTPESHRVVATIKSLLENVTKLARGREFDTAGYKAVQSHLRQITLLTPTMKTVNVKTVKYTDAEQEVAAIRTSLERMIPFVETAEEQDEPDAVKSISNVFEMAKELPSILPFTEMPIRSRAKMDHVGQCLISAITNPRIRVKALGKAVKLLESIETDLGSTVSVVNEAE